MFRIYQCMGSILAAAALIGAAGGASGTDLLQSARDANPLLSESRTFAANETLAGPFAPSAACQTLGNHCTSPSDCCSLTCSSSICINASGPLGCHADSDTCTTGSDCCTGQCTGGTCASLASLGAGTCTIDGEPCSSSDSCCSKNCAATPGGGNACQADSGCHVRSNLCTSDAACCGAAGSGGAGAGNVVCTVLIGSNPPVGTCSNPVGCNSEGDVCGGLGGRTDCCGCMPPSSNCCRADSSGGSRCYGGSTASCPNGYEANTPGCCIAAGNVCTFSDECCGGTPCVPDRHWCAALRGGSKRCGRRVHDLQRLRRRPRMRHRARRHWGHLRGQNLRERLRVSIKDKGAEFRYGGLTESGPLSNLSVLRSAVGTSHAVVATLRHMLRNACNVQLREPSLAA